MKNLLVILMWIIGAKTIIMTRKDALKGLTSLAGLPIFTSISNAGNVKHLETSGLKHSVCKWCYPDVPFEELCERSKSYGLDSVELLNPAEWPIVQRYGLTCAMSNGSPLSIPKGFNNKIYHKKLYGDYSALIPKAADAGIKNIICFSGNRDGISDDQGIENCAVGLDKIVKLGQQYGVTIQMELLNSKVDHPGYMCDRTDWGVELVEKLGSPNFKLLYDIYHMQIMEGDIIATIRRYHDHIGHYHTGGVPGRNEIDETQELNYVAIIKAIIDTGFKGHVAQEFIPKSKTPLGSLEKAVRLCSV